MVILVSAPVWHLLGRIRARFGQNSLSYTPSSPVETELPYWGVQIGRGGDRIAVTPISGGAKPFGLDNKPHYSGLSLPDKDVLGQSV